MGVPEAAVRGKMATDGFDDDMYDKYLNPDTAITVGQELEEDIIDNGDEEKKEQVDILNPDQPESNIAQSQLQSQSQSQLQSQQEQKQGYFGSQSFVPPADSGINIFIVPAID